MRAMRLVVFFAACSVAACSRASSPQSEPAPVAQAPAVLLPAGIDLTGNWASGTGAEPGIATITLHPGCAYNPPVWIIKQTGNVVESWVFPESFNQGIATKAPGPARVVPSRGQISDLDVVIDDGQDKYVLRYDVETQHLRGTRNGRPFWAARQVVVRTEACPGFP